MTRALLALALALALPGLALAGRPLSTEDASTLDDKACQVESSNCLRTRWQARWNWCHSSSRSPA